MKTQVPDNHTGRLSAPNLRLRNSTTIWGPLQLEIISHREGAEQGYRAGEEAYQHMVAQYGRQIGFLSAAGFQSIMENYLTYPGYRPRQLTDQIAAEWKAMFLLAWTAQAMEGTSMMARGGENQ